MEVELLEIRDFLAQHHPFAMLTGEQLDTLPPQMAIRYLRRGNPFPPPEVEMDCLYLLRSGAVALRNQQQVLLEQFAEGDFYSAPCQADNPEQDLIATSIEDCLLYLIPCDVLAQLIQDNQEFAQQLSSSVRARLKRALSSGQQNQLGDQRLLETQTSAIIRRKPISTSSQTSISDAAALMTEERVSALLVIDDGELKGILTDRDLRIRCLAQGISSARHVSSIMTTEVATIHAEAVGFEALLVMTRLNIHHLPVMEETRIIGLLTHSDVLHFERSHAVYIASDINRASTTEELAEIGKRLPELLRQMSNQGSSGIQIGHVLGAVYDAFTIRLLELAERTLGKHPIDFSWMALGSHARRELSISSDQDNALILDDSYDEAEHGAYFEALSNFVCNGLAEIGLEQCPGEVMASTAEWRKTSTQWQKTFDDWFENPTEKAVMLSCNFFDMRFLYGSKSLFRKLSHVVFRQAAGQHRFLKQMAHHALQARVPLGFFRNLVLRHDEAHAHTFDIKAQGLMPLLSIARLYALAAGRRNTNTINRLRVAHKSGKHLSAEAMDDLIDSYHLLTSLRAQHQAVQIEQGLTVDNDIDPAKLSGLERNHLKTVFKLIQRQQTIIEQQFQGSDIS